MRNPAGAARGGVAGLLLSIAYSDQADMLLHNPGWLACPQIDS